METTIKGLGLIRFKEFKVYFFFPHLFLGLGFSILIVGSLSGTFLRNPRMP